MNKDDLNKYNNVINLINLFIKDFKECIEYIESIKDDIALHLDNIYDNNIDDYDIDDERIIYSDILNNSINICESYKNDNDILYNILYKHISNILKRYIKNELFENDINDIKSYNENYKSITDILDYLIKSIDLVLNEITELLKYINICYKSNTNYETVNNHTNNISDIVDVFITYNKDIEEYNIYERKMFLEISNELEKINKITY